MLNSYNELIKTLITITDPSEMRNFLEEILTEKERDTLSLRWRLLKDLNKGVSQREIAKKYHMSLCKITRGSKIIKTPNSVCKKYIN